MERALADAPPATENAYTLQHAGRLLDALEACMADRLCPGRSGWSAASHLARDLERFFGVRAPAPVIDRALRDMGKHRRVQRKVDANGVLWYRLRSD